MSPTQPTSARLAAELKIETLELVGRAMRNNELVTMDDDTITRGAADEMGLYAEEPTTYARGLVLEVTCPDEGMNLLLSTGGTRVYAQHVLDEESWYVAALDGTSRCRITLHESRGDHADALIALNWLLDDQADQIRVVRG